MASGEYTSSIFSLNYKADALNEPRGISAITGYGSRATFQFMETLQGIIPETSEGHDCKGTNLY